MQHMSEKSRMLDWTIKITLLIYTSAKNV